MELFVLSRINRKVISSGYPISAVLLVASQVSYNTTLALPVEGRCLIIVVASDRLLSKRLFSTLGSTFYSTTSW